MSKIDVSYTEIDGVNIPKSKSRTTARTTGRWEIRQDGNGYSKNKIHSDI
jgi:hypothetical protein